MGIEKYLAAASLGLFVMFAGEIITIYDFMSEPPENIDPANPVSQFEAAPKVLQFISIGAAPAVILTGVSFIMVKQYGSRPIGAMIVTGGAVLLGGMSYAQVLVSNIDPALYVLAVTLTPPLFMGVSIPVMIVGALLFRIKKRRPKKEYF